MKNKLPKYFIVKNDGSQEYRDVVINYLNETYNQYWGLGDCNYYGYDGNKYTNGTGCWDNIKTFENKPTLLTLEEFKECIGNEDIKVRIDLGSGDDMVDSFHYVADYLRDKKTIEDKYVVYVKGKQAPKKIHNLESAKKEAKRLAKLHNTKTYVAKLVTDYELIIKRNNY